jgi:glycosyltransferase involved in cell wall biosynthesis
MTTQLSAGGAERQAVTTALGLSRRTDQVESVSLNCISCDAARGNAFYLPMLTGSPVQVTSPGTATPESLLDDPAIAMHRDLLMLMPADLQFAVAAWLLELQRQRPEVVHAWQDFASVAAGIAAVLAGVPRIVLATRNTRPDNKYRRWKRYLQPALQTFAQVDGVVMCNNSRSGAADYDDWLGLPEGATAVVYNGVDFGTLKSTVAETSRSEIRGHLGIPEDAPVVGGVFRLTGEKQPLMWLDAMARVTERVPNAHFILCGGGTMRKEVEQHIAQLQLQGRVHAVGIKSPIAPWYRAMDMLLLASRKEGLPNVLLESQFLGTPVVASDVGGVRETISPGFSGWAVPDATAESLAERLIWSLENKSWLMQARLAGRSYVEDNFAIETMLSRTLDLYGMGAEQAAALQLAGGRL